MSVPFTFECAGQQRRVLIAISCPGNGASVFGAKALCWGLSSEAWLPERLGLMVSLQQKCWNLSVPETFKNQKTFPWNAMSWAYFPALERERGNILLLAGALLVAKGWMAPTCPQPGSVGKRAGRTGWVFLLCSGHLLLCRWNSGGLQSLGRYCLCLGAGQWAAEGR